MEGLRGTKIEAAKFKIELGDETLDVVLLRINGVLICQLPNGAVVVPEVKGTTIVPMND